MFFRFINKTAVEDERELYIDGEIASEEWWGDETTPKNFKEQLTAGGGNITVYINSPGGDCFAASEIYNMLREYKGGKVTVKIDGIAASAASVIAMAGDAVLMAPTAMMMIHNPLTIAFGNRDDMQEAIKVLDEVKESIINAYELKTGLQRAHISRLMDEETWLNAYKAIDLHFADGVIERAEHTQASNYYAYTPAQNNARVVASMEAWKRRHHNDHNERVDAPGFGEMEYKDVDQAPAKPEEKHNETKPQSGRSIDQLLRELEKRKI